jgi:hypothetical protein
MRSIERQAVNVAQEATRLDAATHDTSSIREEVNPLKGTDMTKQLDLTEEVTAQVTALAAEATALKDLVAANRAHNKDLDAFLAPLRVFTRNQSTDAYKASEAAAAVDYPAQVNAVKDAIADVIAQLDVSTDFDTATGDSILAEIKDALAATKYVKVADHARVAAEAAAVMWANAKRDLQSLKPAQYNANRGRGGRGPRGPGQLAQSQGFKLRMECDSCDAVLTSGSNPGSAQDQMANHAASHLNGERPSILYNQHVDIHKGFTQAMNEVLANDTTASGGGWTISRQYVSAAA